MQLQRQKKKHKRSIVILTIGCVIVVVILTVVLCVVLLGNRSSPEPDRQWSPGFSTGVSLITSYAIDAKVRSRLATTELTMEVANALNCSSVHVVTLQLPLNTRVTSLQTTADDGCTSTGEVQELEDAKDTFEEQVAQGLPGAFVEVDDAFTYSLQVSIPPLGVTKVQLVVEQILQQQLGEIFFDIPMIPNEQVDMVVLDLSVEDLSGNAVEYVFDLDVVDIGLDIDTDSNSNGNKTMITSSTGNKKSLSTSSAIHFDIPDARQYDLPRVVQGRYTPEVLPESGLLYADDRCFEHFFVPDSLEGMPRNIHFLLDTSQSMKYDDKLIKAKEAMTSLIETLTPRDTFTIQTFAELGTEELWGSGPGTPDEKEEATDFVSSLNATRYYGTNLNEALLEGMLRAKSTAEKSTEDAVTILFVISDSYASEGERTSSKIVKHVYELNREGTIKIFAMGFQEDADMELLDAIALMTGGVSAPILRGGTTDVAAQIVDFFSSWLGNILLSDVHVDLAAGSARVFGVTQQSFSMLSAGYEVVVRGLLEIPDDLAMELQLRAITSAGTLMGASKWETVALIQQGGSNMNNGDDRSSTASLCFQSYAHARVTQLMRLYEASKFIDHDLILELVKLANPEGCDEEQRVECIKREALALALEAKLVAKGLTAMVTVENETCQKIVEGAEICLDGTTPSSGGGRDSSYPGSREIYYSSAREKSQHGAVSILLALLVVVTTLFQW